MKKLVSILMLVFVFTTISFSQTRAEKRQAKKERLEKQFKEVKALVESKKFQFNAIRALPLGNEATNIGLSLPGGNAVFNGNTVDVSSNYNIVSLNDNNAEVQLQFFGRVFFTSRSSNDTGIKFKGEITDYNIDYNEKKKRVIVKFEAKKDTDNLSFSFVINASGFTKLTVNSTNRQTISYDGNVSTLDLKTKEK